MFETKRAYCSRAGMKYGLRATVPKVLELGRLNEAEYKALFQDVGLFINVLSHEEQCISRYASFEEFTSWFKATHPGEDIEDMDPDFVKEFLAKFTKTEGDGTFTRKVRSMCITGKKTLPEINDKMATA